VLPAHPQGARVVERHRLGRRDVYSLTSAAISEKAVNVLLRQCSGIVEPSFNELCRGVPSVASMYNLSWPRAAWKAGAAQQARSIPMLNRFARERPDHQGKIWLIDEGSEKPAFSPAIQVRYQACPIAPRIRLDHIGWKAGFL
jgi:hypothetical protein